MATLIVHHKVQNYSAWRKVFDDHDKARQGIRFHWISGIPVSQRSE